jgi:hypothetical protein
MYALIIVIAVLSPAGGAVTPVGVTSQVVGKFKNLDQCKAAASQQSVVLHIHGREVIEQNVAARVGCKDVRFWPKADICSCTVSAFGGKVDMTLCGNPLLRSLLGVKRTFLFAVRMSAFDPKRTWHPQLSQQKH